MSESEADFAICQTKATMSVEPTAGSVVRWCDICGAEIWAGKVIVAMKPAQFVCDACAPGVMQTSKDPVLLLSEAQRQEMRDYGVTDAEIDAVVELHRRKYARKPK